MLECVFDNNHCIGERREMSTQNLPAASLRTGNRLPAGRVLLQVSKYLVWMALSSIYSSICGAVSIFLPEAGRPGAPRLGLGAPARSGRSCVRARRRGSCPCAASSGSGCRAGRNPGAARSAACVNSTRTPRSSLRRGVSQANADGVLLEAQDAVAAEEVAREHAVPRLHLPRAQRRGDLPVREPALAKTSASTAYDVGLGLSAQRVD